MQATVPGDELEFSHDLHRGLKARHITMIAIGGAIGTGLIIGTGAALAKAGPLPILISYTIVGFIVYLVMCALGEMAAWLPLGSGFTGYASRFCDPALGFALGWTYWFKYIIVTPNQLTAAALVIQVWVPRERVNPGVFIAVFLVTIIFINYFGIKLFGEFEFWLSSIKVVTICGIIIVSLILACGGGPSGEATGFKYWKDPGAIRPYLTDGHTGRFLAIWSTFVTATFAYLGTELVGVTVGEAQNPRKTIPRAIRLTFFRILIFYCLSVFLLGMILPYNSQDLIYATNQSTGANASPFVAAIKLSGIRHLPGILNACILLFVFSASNSDLYIASRTIYGLALEGKAPRFLAKTDKRGVPIYALALSASFALLAFMNVSSSSKDVFGYFVNLTTIFGILTWISILVTHIFFVRARRLQGVTDEQMPYTAPFGLVGSYGALFACCLIAVFKNFDVFTPTFKAKSFVTGYLGIPLYLIMIFGYKFMYKNTGIPAMQADLYSGKDRIDREEEEFLRRQAAKKATEAGTKTKGQWFYKTFISWLF
ncbi:amino acid permease [Kalaharituber pfeilii]|nr:amino acid permease [Kalaharituber pfeilii]